MKPLKFVWMNLAAFAASYAVGALVGLMLICLLPGCATPGKFYAQNLPDVERTPTPRRIFTKGDVPAVVVSGAAYEGHELRAVVLEPTRLTVLRSTAPTRLVPGRLHTWWWPDLATGRYIVRLLVDGRPDQQFEIVVQR